MIKLLKYDWKRSNDGVLSTLAIFIILEAALSITGATRNWDENLIIAFSIFGYVMTFILLFIHCCRTFDRNLKSYSRRLLPLHPINGIGAAILLGWITMLLVLIIAAIHIAIFLAFSDMDIQAFKEHVSLEKGALFGMILSYIWMYTSFMLSILCSITVARSFRMKHSTWIGIVFYFGIQIIASWLTNKLFDQSEGMMGIVSVNIPQTNSDVVTFGSSFNTDFLFGPFLLELAFTLGYLFLMIYLLKKKVEL
ncbi:hypothetical protein [Bacillus sp. FJAT-28004]|uniref:hypothetical protein n=1 Tax=Bacillus sp. FJAT-28004 TaxID=1679165 RepID=UPI0006B65C08|nr:hypothetical protein [Bacillus sp. FJAT-28004]